MSIRLLFFALSILMSTTSFASNNRQCTEVINLFLAKQNLGSFDKPKKHKSSKTYDIKALGMLAYEKFVTKLKPEDLNKLSSCAAWAVAEKRQNTQNISHKLKEKIMKHMSYNDGYENDPAMEVPMHHIFSKSEKIELTYLAIGGSCDKNEDMSVEFNSEYVRSMYPNLMVYNIVDGSFAENAGFNPAKVEVIKFTEDDKFVVAKENGRIKSFGFYEGDTSQLYRFNESCEVEDMELECAEADAKDLLCKAENIKYLAKAAAKNNLKNNSSTGDR